MPGVHLETHHPASPYSTPAPHSIYPEVSDWVLHAKHTADKLSWDPQRCRVLLVFSFSYRLALDEKCSRGRKRTVVLADCRERSSHAFISRVCAIPRSTVAGNSTQRSSGFISRCKISRWCVPVLSCTESELCCFPHCAGDNGGG